MAYGTPATSLDIEAYYTHVRRGRPPTEEQLADLRRRCAGVLRERLPAAGSLGLDELTEVLLDSLRFTPYADAAPTLATLREAGIRLAVVSNWDCSLAGVLSQVGLGAALDEVVVSAREGITKPDPRIVTLALERLRRAHHEAIFVGDSLETDVAAARDAGVRPVLIDRFGPGSGDSGVETIASLADLPALVGVTP